MGDDGGADLLQIGIAEDVIDMRLGVDDILDAAALLFGEVDHLLQLGDPLGGVDEHGALAGQDHGGVASPDAGEGEDVGSDLLDLNVGRADGIHIVGIVALADATTFNMGIQLLF